MHVDSISRILKQESKIIEYSKSRLAHTRKACYVRSHILENAIVEWVWDMFEKKVNASDSLLQAKAKQIVLSVNENLPILAMISTKFSNGWLEKLKKRNGFKMYRPHDESGDVDEDVVGKELTEILSKLQSYSINDRWNADEFHLFYSMAPDVMIDKEIYHI